MTQQNTALWEFTEVKANSPCPCDWIDFQLLMASHHQASLTFSALMRQTTARGHQALKH